MEGMLKNHSILSHLMLLLVFVSHLSAVAKTYPNRLNIKKLVPTQSVVGKYEIGLKVEKLLSKTDEELQEYVLNKVISVVEGPDGNFYVVDGHHSILAFRTLGITAVQVKILQQFPKKMSMKKFWKTMENKKWVYLKRWGMSIRPKELPRSFDQLEDDPYRSLAWMTRQKNAFANLNIPFQEFYFADLLRDKMNSVILDSDEDYQKALLVAMLFVASEEAKDLPGFIPYAQQEVNICYHALQSLK